MLFCWWILSAQSANTIYLLLLTCEATPSDVQCWVSQHHVIWCRCVPEIFHISFYPANCLIFFFFFLMVCNGQLVQILCHFAVKNMHFRSNDVEESTDLQTGGFFISCFFLFVLNTCKSVIAHFFPELCSWQGHMCYFNVHMYMFNTEIFLCLFNIVTFSFLLLYINHINM